MDVRRNRLGFIAIATAGIGYYLYKNRSALRFRSELTTYDRVKDVMTREARCCTRETPLLDVARMMVESNCGEIPVVDNFTHLRPIGVVTDRDIVCRVLARGRNPLEVHAETCMTVPVITIHQHASIDECMRLMQENRIRRVPVVDRQGRVCGIVSQADLQRISRPLWEPSRVAA